MVDRATSLGIGTIFPSYKEHALIGPVGECATVKQLPNIKLATTGKLNGVIRQCIVTNKCLLRALWTDNLQIDDPVNCDRFHAGTDLVQVIDRLNKLCLRYRLMTVIFHCDPP